MLGVGIGVTVGGREVAVGGTGAFVRGAGVFEGNKGRAVGRGPTQAVNMKSVTNIK